MSPVPSKILANNVCLISTYSTSPLHYYQLQPCVLAFYVVAHSAVTVAYPKLG
jgi:hypothetical protein